MFEFCALIYRKRNWRAKSKVRLFAWIQREFERASINAEVLRSRLSIASTRDQSAWLWIVYTRRALSAG
jgi:hypothetical protein